MKNLKIYVTAATLITISGVVGFTAGINEVNELKETDIVTSVPVEENSSPNSTSVVSSNTLDVDSLNKVTTIITEDENKYVTVQGMHNSVLVNGKEIATPSFNPVVEKAEAEEIGPVVHSSNEEFQYFEEEKQSLREALTNGDVETVVALGENYIQIGKDFVTNGTEINGVTFAELTEQGKMETLQNIAIIDEWVMKVDPDYKEEVKSGVDKTKDFFHDTKEKVYNFFSSFRN